MPKSSHVTLTANTVTTVVVDNDYHGVEVVNVDGAAPVYFTVSSYGVIPPNPTIAGDDTIVLPAAISGVELTGDVLKRSSTTVKLISSGTPKIAVRGLR